MVRSVLRMIAVAAIATLSSCGALMPVNAQENAQDHSGHHHPPQDVELHEKFYSNWMMPDNPNRSCCNKQDCYPTEARFRNGQWQARRREDGAWLSVPASKVELNRDSPDGRNHMCAPPPGRTYGGDGVFCFIAGGGT